jgi:hypothetical protein
VRPGTVHQGEYIKEDKRGVHVEEDKRIQYMGEDRRVQYMEEDKGSRKDLYCTKSCDALYVFVLTYFVYSDCHCLSEKEDEELYNEERRYQYSVIQ